MATRNSNGEGSISETSDGRWTARIQIGKKEDGKPKIKALYAKSEREVKKKLKAFLKSMEEGELDRSKECFGDYLLQWFELYKRSSIKETTYDRNELIIQKRITHVIGHIQVSDLTLDHIQMFFNTVRDAGYSDDYMLKMRQLINGCLSYAEFSGHIKKNPMLGFKSMPKSLAVKKNILALEDNEIIKFVDEATRVYSME